MSLRSWPGGGISRAAWIMLGLVTLAACDVVNIITANWQPMEPPEVYHEWYARVVDCTDTSLSFTEIRWFSADAIEYSGPDQADWRSVGEVWISPSDIIIRSDLTESEPVVRHGMIHFALQRGGHADAAFGQLDRWDGCELDGR